MFCITRIKFLGYSHLSISDSSYIKDNRSLSNFSEKLVRVSRPQLICDVFSSWLEALVLFINSSQTFFNDLSIPITLQSDGPSTNSQNIKLYVPDYPALNKLSVGCLLVICFFTAINTNTYKKNLLDRQETARARMCSFLPGSKKHFLFSVTNGQSLYVASSAWLVC